MKVRELPLKHYVALLQDRTPFAFVRYGNGEWDCLFRRYHSTRSGSHKLTIEPMRADLEKSIRDAYGYVHYYLGARKSSMDMLVQAWIDENCPKRKWVDCTVFYRNSRHGRLFPFIDALRNDKRPLIIVGPGHLRKLNQVGLNIAKFVEIPAHDCYRRKRAAIKEVLSVKKPAIVTISAGPPGKIMVYELWRRMRDSESVVLDLGSLWDVYVGVKSRKYHYKMTRQIIERNLYG